MDAQIGKVCQTCYFWIKNICRVRSDRQIVQSLVISRLDYCNSLLQGLPKYQLTRLQRVQNAAARVIACIPRNEHIFEIRMQLHWPPIQQRVSYKILLLTLFVAHGNAPEYLSELLVLHKLNRDLRSANQPIFTQPHSFTKTFGNRLFHKARSNNTFDSWQNYRECLNFYVSELKSAKEE